jgi:D-3-phosphoglycerate dehydrogenase
MQNAIEAFRSRFDERGIEIVLPRVTQQPTEDELIELLPDFDGIIAGDDPLTGRVLASSARLRVISKWGVGIDGIDLAAAAERGIRVTNTPAVFGDDVADVAAGYLVMLARQLHRIHMSVAGGGWWKHEGVVLSGKAFGIAGYGTIGAALARRGAAFGMHVLAYDIAPGMAERAATDGVEAVDVQALFARSDFLALCMPLTAETHHFVDAARLATMRHGSFIVNVARGGLIDEAALVVALESGQVAAAALDVFEVEPLPAESPLRAFPQCVFGSHNGSNTSEGVMRASELAVENLLAGLEELCAASS